MRWLLGLYAIATLVGALRLAAPPPAVRSPPLVGTQPVRRGLVTNLAAARVGARVVVSSYDPFAGHHPLFAIDEELAPTPQEKWATLPSRDGRAAWLEVELPAAARLDWATLTLAGAYEPAAYTPQRLDVVCRDEAGQELQRIVVQGNRAASLKVRLDCDATRRVRVEFPPAAPPLDRARLYELELWGAAP